MTTPHLDESERAEFREILTHLRDRLIDDETQLVGEARETSPDAVKNSLAEMGTEEFLRDIEYGEAALDQSLLTEILAALQRLEDGSYGICEATGEPIPRERLRAVPWTRYTRKAQEQIERMSANNPAGVLIGDVRPLREASRTLGPS